METKKKTKIYVQMLGGFSITVGDEKLDLGSNSKANFLKLTEIVLLRGMGGVSKRDLIDGIFGHKSLLDENNSLNNLLHQARTQLKKAGMPGRKIIDGKRGVYAPENNPDYEYILDVQKMFALSQKARRRTIKNSTIIRRPSEFMVESCFPSLQQITGLF